jgi:hypothetical protein
MVFSKCMDYARKNYNNTDNLSISEVVLDCPEKKHPALYCYIQALVLLTCFIQDINHSPIF